MSLLGCEHCYMEQAAGCSTADQQVAEAIAAERESLSLGCRADATRLDRLLAPDFHEFGASGDEFGYEGLAARVAAATDLSAEPITVENMRGWLLAEGLVMVKYKSQNQGRRSNRTSLWRRTSVGRWQIFHHQGTIAAGQPEHTRPLTSTHHSAACPRQIAHGDQGAGKGRSPTLVQHLPLLSGVPAEAACESMHKASPRERPPPPRIGSGRAIGLGYAGVASGHQWTLPAEDGVRRVTRHKEQVPVWRGAAAPRSLLSTARCPWVASREGGEAFPVVSIGRR